VLIITFFLSFLYKLLLTVCKVFTLHTVSKSFKLNIEDV